MASNQLPKFSLQHTDLERQITPLEIDQTKDDKDFDYSKRSQWLRAAVLGANDGLVSTASLMVGVGAVKQDIKAMILSGFAGLVAGACSMAIGEFVSVYSQLDIEVAQIKRDKKREKGLMSFGSVVLESSPEMNKDQSSNLSQSPINQKKKSGKGKEEEEEKEEIEGLPNPLQAAAASALAFSVGAMVPLLGAFFIREYRMRLAVVVAAVSLALMVFGWLGAVLGGSPALRSVVRVLVGGWLAMAITFGLTKLIGSSGL